MVCSEMVVPGLEPGWERRWGDVFDQAANSDLGKSDVDPKKPQHDPKSPLVSGNS